MKIAIYGSFDPDQQEKSLEEYVQACKDIGDLLHQNGHDLIVGSDAGNTADRYFVEAFDSRYISTHKTRAIEAYMPKMSTAQAPFQDGMVTVQVRPRRIPGTRRDVRLRALGEADGAIAIGGHKGTYHVSVAAPVAKTPVLAIPSFGGAGRDIWELLIGDYKEARISNDILEDIEHTWNNDDSAKKVVDTLQTLVRNNPYNTNLASRVATRVHSAVTAFMTTVGTILAFGFILALLCAWLYLFFTNPSFTILATDINKNVTIFLLLAITSVLGTSLRAIVKEKQYDEGSNVINNVLVNLMKGLLLAFAFGLL